MQKRLFLVVIFVIFISSCTFFDANKAVLFHDDYMLNNDVCSSYELRLISVKKLGQKKEIYFFDKIMKVVKGVYDVKYSCNPYAEKKDDVCLYSVSSADFSTRKINFDKSIGYRFACGNDGVIKLREFIL